MASTAGSVAMEPGVPGGLRSLLVGVDAACFPVLDPLLAAGELPNLERFVERGVGGPLRSQIPPWTPSAWPTAFTGTNPGKHGLFDFLAFDGYDWAVVDATRLRERPIWETASAAGLSSVVVNVPVTHPPRSFDGALIPGYTAPEDPPCHPAGLLADVRDAVGDYRVYLPGSKPYPVSAYRDLARMRGRAFRYLADRFDPDFGFVQFQVTDTIFHRRPDDLAAVREIYRTVDDEIGEILSACDPENVLVVSDHGIGEYGGYEFRVNEFLRRHGYVETRRGGDGMPSWATVQESRLRAGEGGDGFGPGVAERAMALAARAGVTTQRVAPVVESLGLTGLLGRLLPRSVAEAGAEQVDVPRSRAYMRSRSELGVRINLAGREPDGVVPPGDYESVRVELIDLLRNARTPDGEPVFEDVAPRERYFDGPMAEAAVDVVTVPAGFDHLLSARLEGEPFGPPSEPWNHKRDGLLLASGPGIDATAPADGARLVDVAPTVLATLGVPVDERMDGRVLPIAESVGEERYPPYERTSAETSADDAVEARLADLGYLERP